MVCTSLDSSLVRLRYEMAAARLATAFSRASWTVKYNPNWQLQPRAPAGDPEGGQWISSANSRLLNELLRLG